MKFKVGDTVMIITGKDKGKKGRVSRILEKTDRLIVENLNMVTKHQKKTRERSGERFEKESPIHMSNVMVMCPEKKKPTRIRYEVPAEGKKRRVSVKSGASVDTPFVRS